MMADETFVVNVPLRWNEYGTAGTGYNSPGRGSIAPPPRWCFGHLRWEGTGKHPVQPDCSKIVEKEKKA